MNELPVLKFTFERGLAKDQGFYKYCKTDGHVIYSPKYDKFYSLKLPQGGEYTGPQNLSEDWQTLSMVALGSNGPTTLWTSQSYIEMVENELSGFETNECYLIPMKNLLYSLWYENNSVKYHFYLESLGSHYSIVRDSHTTSSESSRHFSPVDTLHLTLYKLESNQPVPGANINYYGGWEMPDYTTNETMTGWEMPDYTSNESYLTQMDIDRGEPQTPLNTTNLPFEQTPEKNKNTQQDLNKRNLTQSNLMDYFEQVEDSDSDIDLSSDDEVNDDEVNDDEVNDGNTTEVDSDDSEYDPSTEEEEEEEEEESDCLSVEETLQLQKDYTSLTQRYFALERKLIEIKMVVGRE
jgi:hypothetical protein